jgi:TRAP-type mannitol/chloroaromatic compound transport system substrate-binding protein
MHDVGALTRFAAKALAEQLGDVGLVVDDNDAGTHAAASVVVAWRVRGRRIVNSVNSPTRLSTSIAPPCDELIKVFGKLSKEVLADTAAKDPLTRKVYDSYTTFLAGMMDWTELSERGYLDTRRLALG